MNEYTVLIDLVLVAGAALVVPAAWRLTSVGGGRAGADPRPAWWLVAATTALALSIGTGPVAAGLALPWLLVAVHGVLAAIAATRRAARPWPDLDGLAAVAVRGWAVVAGIALVDSCAGRGVLGFGEPIVRLTAVHFTYAGVATSALALLARRAAPAAGRSTARSARAATAALLLVLAAPPVVGLGFVSGAAVAQVGGAVLLTLGTYLLSAEHLAEGWRRRGTTAGRLLLVSGLSTWGPMALAVAWALAQHTGGPALSIPDLVRTHGAINALGFVGCGLAARQLLADEDADADPTSSGSPSAAALAGAR